jgi:hypothetical protein
LRRSRFTSFANSAFAALALAYASVAAHAGCDASVVAAAGAKEAAALRAVADQLAGPSVSATRSAPEREIASNSHETIPTLVRNILVDPINAGANFTAADLYVGAEYNTKSPDIFALPRDARALCLLAPLTAVFLSDDVTHHYATVYAVDAKKEVVTLADPWAQVSFLRAGHNLIGAAARPWSGPKGEALLDVSFKDMMRALHGLANPGRLVPATIEVIDKLYPELGQDESYLFWRYARPLPGGVDAALMTMLELTARNDLDKKPRLKRLAAYANDLAIGVLTDFEGNDGPGGKPQAQAVFLRRLDAYASAMPWALKWTLLQRAKVRGDHPLELAIVEAFLKADAADMDMQIERAALLLDLRRVAEALAQMQASRKQWDRDVAASIAIKPADKAIAAFFAHNYGRSQDQLFAWRYARLSLLEIRAALLADRKAAIGARLTDLDARLGARIRLRVAFFGELADITRLVGDQANEDALVEGASQASLSEQERSHVARAMFEHFTTKASIAAFSPQAQNAFRASPLKAEVCEQSAGGNILPDQQDALVAALAKFCKAKRAPK